LNNTFSLTPEKLTRPTPLDKYLVSVQNYVTSVLMFLKFLYRLVLILHVSLFVHIFNVVSCWHCRELYITCDTGVFLQFF